jgi:hypothetical protein
MPTHAFWGLKSHSQAYKVQRVFIPALELECKRELYMGNVALFSKEIHRS